jgi:transcriptional regulator with XRE-family HTH domain
MLASPPATDVRSLGHALREYRSAHRLTQAQLAELLSMDQSYVSKVETGRRQVRDIGILLRIATRLGLPPESLGLSASLVDAAQFREEAHKGDHSNSNEDRVAAAIHGSQQQWHEVRDHMAGHGPDLLEAAAALCPFEQRIGSTLLLTQKHWLPEEPIEIGRLKLTLRQERVAAEVSGTEPEARLHLPLRSPGHQYGRYSLAIRYLARPALLENRVSYRLLQVTPSGSSDWTLDFGLATYFDKIDVGETLAHELAAADLKGGANGPNWADLPFRALIGSPFDLRRRATLPGVVTLTIRRRRDGTSTFVLHWRDPSLVAMGGRLYTFIPAGEFQPSSIAPWDLANDLDLWRNLVREFSEELLGTPEHDGSQGECVNYEDWSLYRTLTQARHEGRMRVFFCGIGCNPLSFGADLLCVAVIDEEVFDLAFGNLIAANSEGLVVHEDQSGGAMGMDFDYETVAKLLQDQSLAPSSAACLHLAWQHRHQLLS